MLRSCHNPREGFTGRPPTYSLSSSRIVPQTCICILHQRLKARAPQPADPPAPCTTAFCHLTFILTRRPRLIRPPSFLSHQAFLSNLHISVPTRQLATTASWAPDTLIPWVPVGPMDRHLTSDGGCQPGTVPRGQLMHTALRPAYRTPDMRTEHTRASLCRSRITSYKRPRPSVAVASLDLQSICPPLQRRVRHHAGSTQFRWAGQA